MEDNPVKQGKKQRGWNLKDYQWRPGESGNPNGRPPGKTLKEWAKEFLMSLPDDKKLEFLREIEPDIVWRMAEGNPHQTEDITSKGEKIIPIYAGSSLQGHDGNAPSVPNEEKN